MNAFHKTRIPQNKQHLTNLSGKLEFVGRAILKAQDREIKRRLK